MRYSTEPRYRKYVKGYEFLSFAKTFSDKSSKELVDTATKTGIDAGKTASKWVVQKTAEATRCLIGNKIADKIISLGKTKSKEKKWKTKNLHTTRKKTANYWSLKTVLTSYKNGIPKNYKLARYNAW